MSIKTFVFNRLLPKIYKFYLSINTKQLPLNIAENERAILFAPHADDESIGAGGTLARYGKNFDVYCITDGVKGLKSLPPEKAARVRKEEFSEAMKIAGVNRYEVLGVPDRDIISSYETLEKIDISDFDYIFVPNLIDTHKDHKSVSILVKKLLQNKPHKKDVKIVFYEVWSTLALPNAFVDITNTVDKKAQMLECHKSQTALRSYLPSSVGLSRYRGLVPNVDNAECFLVLDEKTFTSLVKNIYV